MWSPLKYLTSTVAVLIQAVVRCPIKLTIGERWTADVWTITVGGATVRTTASLTGVPIAISWPATATELSSEQAVGVTITEVGAGMFTEKGVAQEQLVIHGVITNIISQVNPIWRIGLGIRTSVC